MFSLYLTLKFLHVAAAIIWVGGTVSMTIMTLRASRASQPGALNAAMEHALFYGQRVVGPASIVVLLAGIGMVLSAHMRFMTPWIVWGFAGILIHILLGVTVLRTNGQRLAELSRATNPDRTLLSAALRRQQTAATVYTLIMLSTVWAMVAKPA